MTMDDSLTLDGLTAPLLTEHPFSDDPNIHLLKGRTGSSQTLVPGTYLGNQILHNIQVKTFSTCLLLNMPFMVCSLLGNIRTLYIILFIWVSITRESIL